MIEVMYLLSALLAIAGYILAGVAIWLTVEAIHFIYYKMRRIDY